MSRRAKIIILIVFVLVVVLVVLLLFLGRRRVASVSAPAPGVSPENAPVVSAPAAPPVPFGAVSAPAQGGAVEVSAASREAFVRSFVERYGSYSNQSDFENLEDLYPFMTQRLRQQTEKFVRDERAREVRGTSYVGVTTRALSVRTASESATEARVLVSAQRQEATAANPSGRVYYQDIELSLKNVGDAWRVDAAVWK